MDCLVPTHLGEDNTHQRQQAGAQVGCSHEVRARVWEAPAAGSTPDYSAHEQAHLITVYTSTSTVQHKITLVLVLLTVQLTDKHVLKAQMIVVLAVIRLFQSGCALPPCSICGSARIHHR